ncbi:glycosyltransferase [Microbacterium marinilacus]|uniref:Glycosyltransferase family 2 protein n=1 Tax=Microbacterium marinilacus TaxID=415209 RepID=A0ABP7BAN9_9MICO|nr:glycosyltransferase [Microbacterium marinilacus]MBY0687194.1 glycosyltransferase [Microbacterium marinilacus]
MSTVETGGGEPYVHRISVVVPVYQGEKTLPGLVEELRPLTAVFATPNGHSARIEEVLLAYDRGPDQSDRVIRQLATANDWIAPVWLSRNFGQHAATLAGMASSGGEWIVTIDEDGQHDPNQIGIMLDTALAERADLVYAAPLNSPPHGFVRNLASKASKQVLETVFGGGHASRFHSYRLVLGEIGRSVAAYAGTGVYLDVALSWVAARTVTAPIMLREEGDRRSGYSFRRLFAHFWSMVLTSGTRGLRLVTGAGAVVFAGGLLFALYLVVARLVGGELIEPGWTSLMVVLLLGCGVVLVALGIIAEYLGVAVNMALGKPTYLIVRDPAQGPLGLSGRGGETRSAPAPR